MRFAKIFVVLLLTTSLGIYGCATSSPRTTPKNSRSSNIASSNEIPVTSVAPSRNSSIPKDGTIASMKQIDVPGNSDEVFYQVYYWSAAQKVEAYVIKPKGDNQMVYAIDLNLHGGWLIPKPGVSHSPLGTSMGFLKSIHESEYVMFLPQYRGYEGSQGTVNGVYGNFKDATNAIIAAKSLKFVNPTQLYVEGESMGGCVALMLAERSDVKAIVAMSPFVGWDIFREWAMKHPESSQGRGLLDAANTIFGSYVTNQQTWTNESPDISKVKAPVLLIQGTADKTIPAGSVQELYSDMKKQGKTVELDLISGGNHGFTGKHRGDAIYDASKWFNEHW